MNDLRRAKWQEIWSTVRGDRLAVYDDLLAFGYNGCTGSELAGRMGWSVLSVRPRLTELRHLGLAEETGERRNGEHVLRAIDRQEAERRHGVGADTGPTEIAKPERPVDRLRAFLTHEDEQREATQLNLF